MLESRNEGSRRRNRLSLSDEVAAHVRALIMSGSLQPGEFVRVEKIADDLDVSATPVREGLHMLRGEGFLDFGPRRGFVVAPLSPADIEDLFLVQADIAGELAARAAAVATPEVVQDLHTLQAALNAATAEGRTEDVVEFNRLIHRTINVLAAAPKLSFLLSVAVRYVPEPFFLTIEGWASAAVHEHAHVFTALENNDSEAARESMRHHILHAGELLAEHFRKQGHTVGSAPAAGGVAALRTAMGRSVAAPRRGIRPRG